MYIKISTKPLTGGFSILLGVKHNRLAISLLNNNRKLYKSSNNRKIASYIQWLGRFALFFGRDFLALHEYTHNGSDLSTFLGKCFNAELPAHSRDGNPNRIPPCW